MRGKVPKFNFLSFFSKWTIQGYPEIFSQFSILSDNWLQKELSEYLRYTLCIQTSWTFQPRGWVQASHKNQYQTNSWYQQSYLTFRGFLSICTKWGRCQSLPDILGHWFHRKVKDNQENRYQLDRIVRVNQRVYNS